MVTTMTTMTMPSGHYLRSSSWGTRTTRRRRRRRWPRRCRRGAADHVVVSSASSATKILIRSAASVLLLGVAGIRVGFGVVDGLNGLAFSTRFSPRAARGFRRLGGNHAQPVQQDNGRARKSIALSSASSRQQSSRSEQQPVAPDSRYYSFLEELPVSGSFVGGGGSNGNGGGAARMTLTRYLDQVVKDDPDLYDLESLLLAIQMACKTISNLVHRAGLSYSIERRPHRDGQQTEQPKKAEEEEQPRSNRENPGLDRQFPDGRFYSMERLDSLSTLVTRNALRYTGKCEVGIPVRDQSVREHQPGVLVAKCHDSRYVACLDPLDGSGNADASICTGTVFGVFEQQGGGGGGDDAGVSINMSDTARVDRMVESVLQPGKNMKAAGYCLYSSATVLVFTLGEGNGVQGFTLDPQINEFVLTHPNLTIPRRGSVYSCNEANSEGWTQPGFRDYLLDLKLGRGETGQRYAHRYVGSMVGDIHRTLLYGGIFAYPSDSLSHPDGNLQLLYKSAPMAFVVHHAGGRAIDGRTGNLLAVRPERVHQKSPCFIGSPDDVAELEKYLNAENLTSSR